MSEPTVLVDEVDGIATVTLNRPDSRNALNLPMCHELEDAFTRLDESDDVSVVLLRGAGKAFCAGADLRERRDKDAAWVRRRRLASFAAYRSIERCAKPVIALVHGAVVGSGGEMAMSSDFIYAADDAVFKFPEVTWGTVGATQRLQRVIGPRKAKELLFTGRLLPASEAERLGLVQAVVVAAELTEAGMETARQIAAVPQQSLRITKHAVDLGGQLSLEQGIALEMNAIEQNLALGSWREGISRFADRESDEERA